MDAGVPCQSMDTSSSDMPGRDSKKGTQTKLEMLELAKRLGSVSSACKIMGYSRDSFYRFKRLYEMGGEAALRGVSRRKPILKNRVAPEIEAEVLKLAVEHPTWGQARVARVLGNRGLSISAAGVRCVWLRNELQTTPLRLKAAASLNRREPTEG
jgi:transposase